MIKKIQEAAELLKTADRVAVLTGAGISAESNVPTFRGKDGLWKNFRAEELATLEAFQANPAFVWEWYGYRQQIILKCEPNPAHYTLAEMEKHFREFTLITQNVDGLHERAGSKKILEMHGNIFKARCMKENTVTDFVLEEEPVPKCKKCGALLRPHIVWFGETLDPDVLEESFTLASKSDLFLVIGTSALVQPAASLPIIAVESDIPVIEINLESTPLSAYMTVSIQGKAGEVLPEIYKLL